MASQPSAAEYCDPSRPVVVNIVDPEAIIVVTWIANPVIKSKDSVIMADPRLTVIAKALRDYTGECTCDEAYTGRKLEDPNCQYHIVPNEEAAADIIAALDAMGKEKDQPAPLWNVFLYDPQRKYGDYMVIVQAQTAEEAEAKALTGNPGASIAHPTAPSPYSPVPEHQ